MFLFSLLFCFKLDTLLNLILTLETNFVQNLASELELTDLGATY